MSATPAQRAAAARALRAGASESRAARKAKVCKRTVQRWKRDPTFAAGARNEMRITLGQLPAPVAPAPATDLLDGLPPSRAWVSVLDGTVIGSALHPLANPSITNNCDSETGKPRSFTGEVAASIVFVELIQEPERVAAVHDALAAGELPEEEPHAVVVPLTLAGLVHIQNDRADLDFLLRAVGDFRSFLDVWQFTDQEHGQVRLLGDALWPAQEEFVRATAAAEAQDEQTGANWLYVLKARKLGETTIACAYDAWVLRFRDQNARVHLFSRREDAALELLQAVKFGLERLPAWLQLPVVRSTATVCELRAGPDDRRLVKAYPADKETAVESSCTHGHIDEWARMGDPAKVWQAIEPTMAGSCHIVTTGLGPTNFTAKHWRRCLAGDARHYPCFIGALARPDRSEAWLRGKRTGMDEQQFRQEYPTTWQDALSGGGDYVFRARDLDGCARDFHPPGPAQPDRKYVKAWDIGRHQDAAVGVVLDVTEDVHDIVCYRRLRAVSYPEIQREIETLHKAYRGPTVIEDNAAGQAVRENLNLPEHQVLGFTTNRSSKARIIEQLKIAVQNWTIKWDAKEFSQLDAEMRGYQQPDDNVEQDSVIALAIARTRPVRIRRADPRCHPGLKVRSRFSRAARRRGLRLNSITRGRNPSSTPAGPNAQRVATRWLSEDEVTPAARVWHLRPQSGWGSGCPVGSPGSSRCGVSLASARARTRIRRRWRSCTVRNRLSGREPAGIEDERQTITDDADLSRNRDRAPIGLHSARHSPLAVCAVVDVRSCTSTARSSTPGRGR